LDKAPDAFRTISEVADDLDIPQHVLRFWETRFTQIKPMKRSGGRRYYRPDDVDLLRGIRRLLYGEGYTIRGVQRILKEQGIKAVQGLADKAVAPPSSAQVTDSPARRHGSAPDDDEGDTSEPAFDADDEEVEAAVVPQRQPVTRPPPVAFAADPRPEPIVPRYEALPVEAAGGMPRAAAGLPAADATRLKAALEELIACKQLVDAALKGSAADFFPSNSAPGGRV
jgi:DNA-binding transcriptional MerR regulator